MQLDDMMSCLKKYKSVPDSKLRQRMVNAVQHADGNIKTALFNAVPASTYLTYNAQQGQAALKEFAVKYAAFVVSQNTARSFHASVCNVSYSTIQQWFSSNGATVGLWMTIDCLVEEKELSNLQASKNQILSSMVEKGKDPVFINGFLVECDTGGSSIPAKLFLNLISWLDTSGQSLQSVLPAWKSSERWSNVQDYDTFNWFAGVAALFAQETDAYNTVKTAVDQAIGVRTGPYSYTRREVVATGVNGIPLYSDVTHERYEYGEALLNWLNLSDGPSQYQMRSGSSPNNFEEKQQESSGCIRENTPIRMADGSVKLIQHIEPGDLVLNGHGTFSVCSTEQIYNPFVLEMYSINEESVFLSPEHALMTDRGWCSLNPYLSKQLNPNVTINRLEVGDRLWRFKPHEDGSHAVEKVVVANINVERAESQSFIGYDLHFSEGYHSYYANDYLCLLSYPEMTIANILANVKQHMSAAEEIQFISMVRHNELLFRKAFGNEAMNHFLFSISRLGGKV